MNKQKILTGSLLLLAAITFWISWFLMPDPGTTDTNHILAIVKQARTSVLCSVIIQIVSSILYVSALFLLTRFFLQKKIRLAGVILFGIGAMGLCADAFFHLLAYFMTDDSVNIQQDVVRVMNFMQTTGVVFLIPLLLPLFVGSLVLAIGLKKQRIISKTPTITFITAFAIGIIGTIIAKKVFEYNGPVLSLVTLGMFAAGQTLIGLELMNVLKKKDFNLSDKKSFNSINKKQTIKQFIVLAAVLCSPFTALLAQNADDVKGIWLNDEKDAKVDIYKSGNEYFGKLIWVKEMYELDGKTPKKDSKNSNEKLRSRSILNLIILSGFTYDDGEWSRGEIYDPKTGKTYKSKIKLKGGNLEIRGYIGSPMLGKTTVWTKAS